MILGPTVISRNRKVKGPVLADISYYPGGAWKGEWGPVIYFITAPHLFLAIFILGQPDYLL